MSLKMLQSKSFSFTLPTKNIELALKKVNAVAGASGNAMSLFLSSDGSTLSILAVNSDCFARVEVEAKVEGAGCFGLDSQNLVGIIKGRSDMAFNFNGSECQFKQLKGKYNGHLVTQPLTKDMAGLLETYLAPNEKSGSNVPGELMALIGDGLKATAISDVYQGTTLLTYIQMDGRILKMSSFATQHFAFYQVPADFPKVKISIALPANYFSVINAVSEGSASKLYMNTSNIRVQGKGFLVILPSSQVEEKHFETVEGLLSTLKKPEFACKYSSSAFSVAVENLISLYSTNTNFELASSKDSTRLEIKFTTQNGAASDAIDITAKKNSKPFKASVDPRLIKNVVSVVSSCDGEPILSITDRVILLTTSYKEASVQVGCSKWE